MKRIFLLSLFSTFFLFSFTKNTFAQCDEWIITGGAATGDFQRQSIYGVATDSNNVYMAAIIDSAVGSFHGVSFNATTITNGSTLIVTKVDSLGQVQWLSTIEGDLFGVPHDIFYRNGSIYLIATFQGNLVINGQTIQRMNQTILLVKYDENGNVQWYKDYEAQESIPQGNIRTWMPGITVDQNGDVIAVGYLGGEITFAGQTLSTTISTSERQAIVLKWDKDGNELWGKISTNNSSLASNFIYTRAWTVTTDSQGDIIFGGLFTDEITIGDITETAPNALPQLTPYVVKLDGTTGNGEWIRVGAFSTTGSYEVGHFYGVRTDKNDNVVLAGVAETTILFDNITLYNANNEIDIIIVKYDPNGNVIFARNFGADASLYGQWATDINIDNNNGIYFSGTAGMGASFDSLMMPIGGQNAFLVHMDSLGNVLNLKYLEGSVHEVTQSAIFDSKGSVYLVGFYSSDTLIAGNTTVTPTYDIGIFLWKACVGNVFTDVTDINISESVLDLEVNPNPSRGQFIATIESTETQMMQINIFNELGQVIYFSSQNINVGKNSLPIQLSHLPTGIYYFTIRTNNEVVSKKIVKF